MKILVVNDDGIQAEGIRRLAAIAQKMGEVCVIAPAGQCSAMSHRITVLDKITAEEHKDFLPGVKAFSISGTPADCVKAGLGCLLEEKPDLVISGINNGFNAGMDIVYSGTVGAAMEALQNGIPAIAVSNMHYASYDIIEKKLSGLLEELAANKPQPNHIWNINFPGCSLAECRGILYDRKPAPIQFYHTTYVKYEQEDGTYLIDLEGRMVDEAPEGTDIKALIDGYVSVGSVECMIY